MPEPWLALFLVFTLLFLAGWLAFGGLSASLRARRQTARRYRGIAPSRSPPDELDRLLRRGGPLAGSAVAARFRRLLVQSGTKLNGVRIGGLFGVLWLVLVLALSGALSPAPRIAASGLLSALLILGYLRLKRARRMARFGEQLPEVIDIIVRSLRAGHPLPVSLALVAREMPEPAGPEFVVLVDEVNYGRSLPEALGRLRDRVGYPELQFLVASVSIAHQTGGNLGDVLSRLSRLLRDRFRLMRRARALSAEGRFSGLALSALPLLLFGLINLVSPSFYAEFWGSPSARTILAVSLVLLLLGNLTIYRLVNFKV